MGELAHLPAVERAIGDGDAQHVGVKLQIDAVHQPQGLERILGDLAGQTAARPGR
jgi:cyanate lyase